jgi:isocitrate dehydrogenase (NAD+)
VPQRVIVVPGDGIGDDVAVFEVVHGSAPDIARKHVADRTALMCSAVLMLRHLGNHDVADRVMGAIRRTLSDDIKIKDVGGMASTTEFTEAVVARLDRGN